MKNYKTTVLSVVIAGLSGVSPLATAAALEEVVVTAQKRTESLQDVPISVSAISGEKISDVGIQNFQDVSAYVPNFTVQKESIGDKISIRGIASGNQAGFEQSVGTFVDGIYRGRNVQSRFAFLDIGMLEVLRGPQGTLFGKNTIAGALNITSAKPTDELEGQIKVAHNIDFDQTEFTGFVSGPLSDTVRGRIAFMQREMREGWGENTFYNTDQPQTDEWAARFLLQWDAGDNTTVEFKYEHGDWVHDGRPWDILNLGPLAAFAPAFGLEDDLDWKISHGNDDPLLDFGSNNYFEGDLSEYVLTVNHELENSTLTAIVGFSEYDFERNLDADYGPFNILRFDDREKFEQTSIELRMVSDGASRFNYIAGLYWQDADLVADGLTQLGVEDTYTLLSGGCAAGGGVPSLDFADNSATTAATAKSCLQTAQVDAVGGVENLPGVARFAVLDQNTETMAVFAQATFDISDRLRTTLGVRYTEEEKDARQAITAPVYAYQNRDILETDPTKVFASAAFLEFTPHDFDDLKRDEESFTWSANIQWDVTDDAMAYATASTGFKAGGFNSFYMGQAALAGASADDVDFEEEEVITFEVGVKMSLLDGEAELNFAAFVTEYDDLQVAIFSGNTTFEVQNAAIATTQGIELDGRWQATDNLLMSGAFGWIDFEYDDFPNQACTSVQFVAFREAAWDNGNNLPAANLGKGECAEAGVNDLSGNTSAFTPEFSATLSANYTQYIGDFALDFGLDVLWRDNQYVQDDLDPQLLSDSVTKLNGRIRLTSASDSWEIALVGNNITDVDDDLIWGNDTPLVEGSIEATIAQGASYTLSALYRF